ncbi:MAG: DNA replication and repair protein RecF [Bacteroidales bacterium]|nr:DNA replication and repair protein RecF [Bacteroidales bacterium]
MFLSRILITDFKNIASADLVFSDRLNCISGSNGSGKTNLLDAVYSLSMAKSFFNFQDCHSVRHSQRSCALAGYYNMDDGSSNKVGLALYAEGEKENKTMKRNDKAYKRLADHIGLIPIVMVSPQDSSLINLSAEERRRFLNALLSQIDREYLDRLQRYNKTLMQRNRLLKDFNVQNELLEVFDTQLCENSAYIFQARERLCEVLQDSVQRYYSKVSGEKEKVRIIYQSELQKHSMADILKKNLERDKVTGFTNSGIHRDDLLFEMDSLDGFHPLKRTASQGQQKCFQIALKLAQFDIMKERTGGVSPILLLDDVFDKLDMERVEYLLQMVSGSGFGQIFITDSNKVRMDSLVEKVGGKCRNFEVKSGTIVAAE